jgi:hypothetical protein
MPSRFLYGNEIEKLKEMMIGKGMFRTFWCGKSTLVNYGTFTSKNKDISEPVSKATHNDFC